MEIDALYQDLILDHYKYPRCQEPIESPSTTFRVLNPLCGDKVELSLKIENGKILKVYFAGQGCCISQAATSMMSELCQGKTVAEAKSLVAQYRMMMKGECCGAECPELAEARSLEGVKKFSARIKCALLGWEALERCLDQYDTIADQDAPAYE